MDVGDVMSILNGMKSDFVGDPVRDATLDSATRHPDGKTVDVMVASVSSLSPRRAAKLARKHDHGRIQKASLLEIFQQCCDRLIHGLKVLFMIRLQCTVSIPNASPPAPC